jgi:hypothetical protein
MKITTGPVPAIGLLTTILAAVWMVLLASAQETTAGDFTKATAAELRDGQGQAVLRGEFTVVEEDDGEVERRAALMPTGVDPDAAGEAEVEFDTSRPAVQEIEVTGRNLDPGGSYTLLIDGQQVASVKADARGRVAAEWEIPTARR